MPWLSAKIDQRKAIFGPDWWPCGIEPNHHTLEAVMRYMKEQGLMEKTLNVEDLFAPSVVGEFKV